MPELSTCAAGSWDTLSVKRQVWPIALMLLAVPVMLGCADEASNCSEVPGSWSMTFYASDWNRGSCTSLAPLNLTAPTPRASECHAGCTCTFDKFTMRSEHDEDDFCGSKFREVCEEQGSSLECSIALVDNTVGSGFCRMTLSRTDEFCDYDFDFDKR